MIFQALSLVFGVGGGMGALGTVVLVVVNLFSSLFHLNADLSQRVEASLLPLPPTWILNEFSFFLEGVVVEVECCWP